MAAISGTRTEQEKKEEDGENRWIDQTGHNCAAAAAAIEDTTWTQSVRVSWRQQEKNHNKKKKKQTRNGAKAASSKQARNKKNKDNCRAKRSARSQKSPEREGKKAN